MYRTGPSQHHLYCEILIICAHFEAVMLLHILQLPFEISKGSQKVMVWRQPGGAGCCNTQVWWTPMKINVDWLPWLCEEREAENLRVPPYAYLLRSR